MKDIILTFVSLVGVLAFSCFGDPHDDRGKVGETPPTIILRRWGDGLNSRREDRNTSRIKTVEMFNASSIWLLTDFTSNQVFSTRDSGKSWTELRLPGVEGFQGLDIIDSLNGRLLDTNGGLWQTSDAGHTWNLLSTDLGEGGDQKIFESNKFIFNSKGAGLLVDSFRALRSEDGGKTWAVIREFKSSPTDVYFVDPLTGWASVYDVPSDRPYRDSSLIIYRTDDGGKSWRAMETIRKNLSDSRLFFLNEEMGWLTATSSEPLSTRDGGTSWTHMMIPENFRPRSVFWNNSRVGWLVGYSSQDVNAAWPREGESAAFRTTDGGKTWEQVKQDTQQPFFDRVVFHNEKEGWIIGREKVYLTRDGGKSWNLLVELLSQAVK
jgi:photosystem II stability/assembly factor-like uncharacterized protein